jgi:hypothetical protein
MRLRHSLTFTRRTAGLLATSAILATAGFAQTSTPSDKPTSNSRTMTQQQCEQLTGANRTDCEKRAQEGRSVTASPSAVGSRETSNAQTETNRGAPSSSDASSSDRTRLSQGSGTSSDQTSSSSSAGATRGEAKGPSPSANRPLGDTSQTDPETLHGSDASNTQRSPARTDAENQSRSDSSDSNDTSSR